MIIKRIYFRVDLSGVSAKTATLVWGGVECDSAFPSPLNILNCLHQWVIDREILNNVNDCNDHHNNINNKVLRPM